MFGGALVLILGALAVGSGYGWGTWKTVFTQGPSRPAAFGGTLVALLVLVAGLVLATLGARPRARPRWSPPSRPSPAALPAPRTTLATSYGGGVLILGMWAPVGVLLGMLARGPALAVGLGLVWSLVVENLLRGVANALPAIEGVTNRLPGTAAGSLAGALGGADVADGGAPGVLHVLSGAGGGRADGRLPGDLRGRGAGPRRPGATCSDRAAGDQHRDQRQHDRGVRGSPGRTRPSGAGQVDDHPAGQLAGDQQQPEPQHPEGADRPDARARCRRCQARPRRTARAPGATACPGRGRCRRRSRTRARAATIPAEKFTVAASRPSPVARCTRPLSACWAEAIAPPTAAATSSPSSTPPLTAACRPCPSRRIATATIASAAPAIRPADSGCDPPGPSPTRSTTSPPTAWPATTPTVNVATPTSGTATEDRTTSVPPASPPMYVHHGSRSRVALAAARRSRGTAATTASSTTSPEPKETSAAQNGRAGPLGQLPVDPGLQPEQRAAGERDRGRRSGTGEQAVPMARVRARSAVRALVPRTGGPAHSTILEIGISRMSRAPAAFRAGISVLTPRLGTTVSTAFMFPRASAVTVGEDSAGSMSVTAASLSAATLSFSRTCPRAWIAPAQQQGDVLHGRPLVRVRERGGGSRSARCSWSAASRGSAARSCAATSRSRSGRRSRRRCRAPWPRSRRTTGSTIALTPRVSRNRLVSDGNSVEIRTPSGRSAADCQGASSGTASTTRTGLRGGLGVLQLAERDDVGLGLGDPVAAGDAEVEQARSM